VHAIETRVGATRTLCMQYRQEWGLREHCACSIDRSGGYQGIEHVPGRAVVDAIHCALVFNRKPIPTAVRLTVIE